MFGFLEFEDDPDVVPAMLEAAARLAARARPRPHDRPDGLHDERRVRRDDRGLRAPADDQAALAPALLPAALRGGRPRQGDGPPDVGARHLRPRAHAPDHLHARRAARGAPRRAHPQDVAALAAARHGPLRRGLQRGLERELGLLAVLEGGPRPLRPGDAARLRPALVHGRRDEGGRDGGGRHHRARPQPGAQEDERQAAAARLVALPAPQQDHRPRARRLPRRQAGLPAHRASRPRSTSSTSTWPT